VKRWMLACAMLIAAPDVVAQTAPSDERCLEAYEKGQRLRLKHQLREARAEFLLCARAPCPASFRPECTQWFDDVQLLVPSVIVRADADTRVLIDGVVVKVDGTPIELDPGEHLVRFEPKGAAPTEQKVLIVEGEKARALTAPATTLATPPPPSEPKTSVVPWIFVGVGAVALGSFGYFGATGLGQRNRLDECHPYCAQSDIDTAKRNFVIADVSLGVSLVSFGFAAYTFLSKPAPTTTALRLNVSPQFVGLVGVF
jgi:hypothetical protein